MVFSVCTTSVVAKNTMEGNRECHIPDCQPVSHWLPEMMDCLHSVYAPLCIRFDRSELAVQDAGIVEGKLWLGTPASRNTNQQISTV